MANEFKVTWFFTYGRGGFSTSHWIQGSGYDLVETLSVSLAKIMLKMCGVGVDLPYIRVSREDVKGDSKVFTTRLGAWEKQFSVPAPEEAIKPAMLDLADAWWTAVLLRLGSSPQNYSHQFFRGVPDSLVILPGGKVKDAAWDKALKDYFKALDEFDWGYMGITKSATSRKKITNIAGGNGAAPVVITTSGNHDFIIGQKIKIGGVKPANGLNGTWTIAAVPSLTTATLDLSTDAFVPATLTSKGEAWSITKVFLPYNSDLCTAVRITSRKAGRPFDVLVGKRSKKA